MDRAEQLVIEGALSHRQIATECNLQLWEVESIAHDVSAERDLSIQRLRELMSHVGSNSGESDSVNDFLEFARIVNRIVYARDCTAAELADLRAYAETRPHLLAPLLTSATDLQLIAQAQLLLDRVYADLTRLRYDK